MKKYLFPVISSLIIGYVLATMLFKQYEYDANVKTVFNNGVTVYFLQQGVYSSLDNMKESMKSFNYYIYSFENDKYYTYIGVTKNKENLTKLKGYYEKKGYTIYVKEIDVNNTNFITILEQYDNLLATTDNEDTINAIMMQALSKYEELVKNGKN
jgi:hypothetical protein